MSNPTDQRDGDKKRAESFRDTASFINNAQANNVANPANPPNPGEPGSKPKSNLLEIPSISLPKGGGAMKGIDEKFSVNAANGTAAFSIPLPVSSGRKGSAPELSLSYNSGGGNSIFGLGWSVGLACIQRKTEKELPAYRDAEESDTFIFSGSEDLIPELVAEPGGNWVRKTAVEGTIAISYYRPRVESGFARIEKLNDAGNIYWRVRTGDNKVAVFGKSDDAKLFSPVATEGKDKIFRWCLEYSYDDKGNFIQYVYKKENSDNVLPSLCEKNRLNNIAPCANIYLKSIKYGNTVAWYEGDPVPTAFLFEVVFDYGEHDAAIPTTAEVNKWLLRQDPFSDYHPGFEMRTWRLCRRILQFHHFSAELGVDDYLVRSMDLGYDENPNITYLDTINQTGYIWNTDGGLQSKRSLPPIEFSYFKPGFSQEVKVISPDNIMNAPTGLDNTNYLWTDLLNEGISGILSEQATGWYYKENLGNGQFSPARIVQERASLTGLQDGSLSIQDLEADGRKYLVSTKPDLKGYYAMDTGGCRSGGALGGNGGNGTGGNGVAGTSGISGSGGFDGQWEGFRAFVSYPNIDLHDPNLKFIDLNGDGIPDMLYSKEQEFIWYAGKGKLGYDDYHLAVRAADDEQGPQILFANKDEKMLVAIADMSGDGLSDIVLITYGCVCYYPNLGYGRFGAKVTMSMNGSFDNYSSFNPEYLHLSDIDGSGTTDIIYIGNDEIQVWFNQSGNSLADPSVFFNPFPPLDNQVKISFVDLLGTGVSCLVWSSALPSQDHAPLRYIDLMNGRKPHVMSSYKNNMGKEVALEYRSSTQYYLDDKLKGIRWATRLAFPVQCVSKVTVSDKVSQTRFTNEYSYHHGYYDSREREFRGFAMVEQKDCEEYDEYVKNTVAAGASNTTQQNLYQAQVLTKTWYHTGAYIGQSRIFHQLQNEYFPQALLKSGQLTAADLIPGLADYLLDQRSTLPDGPGGWSMEADVISECFRALKGLPLRQEVYSMEGDAKTQLYPYTVTQHDYDLQMLQPKMGQKYGAFLSHEKEVLTFNYERNPLDPRISHMINVQIDPFGNVLQAASIVYGRRKADPGLPTDADRQKQTVQQIIYTTQSYTAPIDIATAYRLPVSFETQTWELNAPAPAKLFFQDAETGGLFAAATVVLYEQQTITNQKRKIGHSRTLYLSNDLKGPMPPGVQDTLALPYENYVMAFTPTLVQSLYGGKFDDGTWRNKARYMVLPGDLNYWINSGRTYFHPDLTANPDTQTIPAPGTADIDFAKSNFYLPIAYEDNFGYLTKVFYDPNKLFITRTVDAANNEGNVDGFNYRTLTPWLLRDANDNRSGIRLDELGLVIRTFLMGKQTESKGDPIDTGSTELSVNDQPTSLLEYDFRYYTSGGLLPDVVKTSVREQHYYSDPLPAQSAGGIIGWLKKLFGGGNPVVTPAAQVLWQDNYSYSDGSGHEVLKKMQAEPGIAPVRDAPGNLVFDGSGNVQQADTGTALRWIGNGRTIYNNKGKAVKQYEPYFDSSFEYNNEAELAELGYTAIMYYDALGRVVRTDRPNGTFAAVEFDAWMQKAYDENDTVQDSAWYKARIGGGLGEAEQEAAQKAAVHYNTPSVTYLDALGRNFLAVADNKTQRSNETVKEELYYLRSQMDIQGNILSITDTKGNVVMSWEYDMLANICYQSSMDGGERWMLADVMGKPLRTWDSRQQIFNYQYDMLHRPLNLLVNTGAGDTRYEQFQYGEGVSGDKQNNLRGKLFNHYDTAGLVNNEAYDFKGNRLASTRTLLKDYKSIPDWSVSQTMDTESFNDESAYDALNRPIQLVAADKSIFVIGYGEGGLLATVDVQIRGAVTATHFVTGMQYNAKRQRVQMGYGNSTTCTYNYDPVTFRLSGLLTKSGNGNTNLQDLNYTYDPVGNITRQFDNAQKTVFYGGQQVDAQNDYIYDAVYRLVEGEGREHVGQIGNTVTDNFNDSWCRLTLQPNSPVQLRNYTQKYFYDGTGNILKMQHIAAGTASWTRTYQYNATNNQLIKTSVSGASYLYSYNAHGSMLTMPQIAVMDWNFREELQHANLGGGGDAYYVYDSSGQRIRKVIALQGNKTQERIYLGAVEIYRERTGGTITLERSTLHIMDDKKRISMVDSRTKGNDGSPAQLIRYQYSDHLGSAALELDDAAKIISYEEYHPFGTTAYQATDASRQVPAKRYRYTGMERDEETGLNYHTARYYIPWLGRWSATDPAGIRDGLNIYAYVRNNPVKTTDTAGTEGSTLICVDPVPPLMKTCFWYRGDGYPDKASPGVQLLRLRLTLSDSAAPKPDDKKGAEPAKPDKPAAKAEDEPDGQGKTNVNTNATNSSGTSRQGDIEKEVTVQSVIGGNNKTGFVGTLGVLTAVRFSLDKPFTTPKAPYVYSWDIGVTGGYAHAFLDKSNTGTFGLTARYGRGTSGDAGDNASSSHGVSLSAIVNPSTDSSGAQTMPLVLTGIYIYERVLTDKTTMDFNALGTLTLGGGSTLFTNVNLLNTATLGAQLGFSYDLGSRWTLGYEFLAYGTGGSGAPDAAGGTNPAVADFRAGGGLGVSRRFGDNKIPSGTAGFNVDGFYQQSWSHLPDPVGWSTVRGGGITANLGGTF